MEISPGALSGAEAGRFTDEALVRAACYRRNARDAALDAKRGSGRVYDAARNVCLVRNVPKCK